MARVDQAGSGNLDLGPAGQDLKRRAVRGVAAKVFSQSSSAALQLISGIVTARLLVPDDFGLVAIVTAYTMILSDVGELGLAQAIVQAEKVTHEQVSWLFWINLGVSTAVAALFSLSAPLLAWFYHDPRLVPITIVFASGFVLRGVASQHLGILNRNMRFSVVATIETLGALVSVIIGILMAWTGWGYWALVMRRMTVFLVAAIGAWWCSGWRPGYHFRVAGTGPFIRFGAHCLGAQSLSNLRQNSDKMLLGLRYGSVPLGLYDRASQLFVLPFNQLTSPLAQVAVSTLSRLRSEPSRYHRYYLKMLSAVTFVGMGLSVVLTIVSEDTVVFALGAKWAESGAILAAFGPGIGMMLLSSAQNWLHLSLGRADRLLRWNLVMFVGTVASMVVGLRFGPVGVAGAYSVALYLLFAPGIWYAGKPIDLPLSASISAMWRYVAAAGISGVVSWYVLNRMVAVSGVYQGLGLVPRIVTGSAMCSLMYLVCIVILYGGPKPLMEFVGLTREVLPRFRRS